MLTIKQSLVLVSCALAWSAQIAAQAWKDTFAIVEQDLATIGENPYFVLKPGYQLSFANKDDTLVITVLNETKTVGGIEARVVEERETEDGELIEVSRNYFAISQETRDVYYLGEDVDMYKKGQIVSHDGTWHHGVQGARLGLMMPGKPAIGLKYYQEVAKGVAMDRAEILSLTERVTTKAGSFERVLRTRETTPLERFAREYKLYAPGIGLVKDGDFELVSHQFVTR